MGTQPVLNSNWLMHVVCPLAQEGFVLPINNNNCATKCCAQLKTFFNYMEISQKNNWLRLQQLG